MMKESVKIFRRKGERFKYWLRGIKVGVSNKKEILIFSYNIYQQPRILLYHMKKYVAKEDVEKGLVNPNIPLT